jgi:hypothetical protein
MKDGNHRLGRSVHDDGYALHAFPVVSRDDAIKGLQFGIADHQ